MSGSHALPQRGLLTDILLDYLETRMAQDATGIVVCDQIAGPGVGWPAEPGEAGTVFTPYAVLKTGPANNSPSGETPGLASQHSSWLAGYLLSCYGGDRQQCDWAADKVRAAVLDFRLEPGQEREGLALGGQWGLEAILFNQLGAINVNQAVNPPILDVTDQVFLRINRSRTRST